MRRLCENHTTGSIYDVILNEKYLKIYHGSIDSSMFCGMQQTIHRLLHGGSPLAPGRTVPTGPDGRCLGASSCGKCCGLCCMGDLALGLAPTRRFCCTKLKWRTNPILSPTVQLVIQVGELLADNMEVDLSRSLSLSLCWHVLSESL